MAGLFASSPHPCIFYPVHKTPRLLLPPSLNLSFQRNPKLSRFPPPSAGKARRIRIDRSSGGDDEEPSPLSRLSGFTDEWGERTEPEVEPIAEADPPKNDDEWGSEAASGGGSLVAPVITDEWGEKAELEPEEPAKPDPPVDDDEWGNGTPRPDDKLGDLKRCLIDTFYGTELGFRASAEVRGEIVELVSQLEAQNPTPAPIESPELLDGNWILLYTAFSELLPLLAVGTTPALKIKKISQSIDSKNRTIVNTTTLASPFATLSFSASASFEVQSPSRIQVQFKEGALQPPEVSSTVNLPENFEIFGQKIDLHPVERALNPLQQAVANIFRVISGQPPLRLPIPGNRAKSWLLTTYLDRDFRISRGDGGLFVLAKEGSPLLQQLS
ncbi:probable plastid-lipid-associated protein 3, chloroplastic [Phalaenopsis equestris]|uniref:probable plastid-lipid-associated protein 3, chloroplastic n=1 Tax=Phalaenopsis equestris TaxID=78828 RepID=UPI0009E1D569|nr:probable plastid-lipid-associated protein 3, chloroplastic [Phalaenopsis equestris]